MPLSVEDFKKVWNKRTEDIREQARQSAGTDTRATDLAELDKRIELENRFWTDKEVDTWPDGPRLALDGLRQTIALRRAKAGLEPDAGLRKPILREALNLLDALHTQIDKTAKLRARCKEVSKEVQELGKSVSKLLKTQAKAIGEDDEDIIRMTQEKDSIVQQRRHVLDNIAGVGQFETATVEFQKLKARLNKLFSDLNGLEFREFQTMSINQGTFARPGQDIALLDQTDSNGVCKAMVLDFLGVGGSNQEAGKPIEAQITSRHFQAQNSYGLSSKQATLNAVDVFAQSKIGDEIDDLEEQLRRNQTAIDTARDTIDRLGRQITGVQAQILQSQTMLQNRQQALLNANTEIPASFAGKGQMLDAIGNEVRQYQQQLQDQQQRERQAQDLLRQWRDHLQRLDTTHRDLESRKTEAVRTARDLMEATRTLSEKAIELTREFEQKKAMSGPLLPSAVLDMFGLALVEDSVQETLPTGKTMTADEVVGAVRTFLDGIPEAVPISAQISVSMKEGNHAIGLRATRPGGEVASWDIEFFDPNANGYRFSDLGKFLGFLPKFYANFYASAWTALRIFTLEVASPKSPEDPQSLLGPSVATAWKEDWGAVQDVCIDALSHPNLPAVLIGQIKDMMKKIEGIFPVHAPETATQVDLKIARTYLAQLGGMCLKMLEEQENYDLLQAVALESLKTGGNQAARDHYATAVRLHSEGNIVGGYVQLNIAIEHCDMGTWQGRLASIETPYLEAIKAHPGEASNFRALHAYAIEQAEAGAYDTAILALDRLNTRIEQADLAAQAQISAKMRQWQTARGSAITTLRKLQSHIQTSGHEMAGKAVQEINAIIANLKERPATLQAVDELIRYVTTDEVFADIETENPYKLPVVLRGPLGNALDDLRQELAA